MGGDEDEDEERGGSADLLKSVATAYPASKARVLLKEAFKIRQLSRRQVEAAVRKAAKLCQGPVDRISFSPCYSASCMHA